MRKRSVSDSRYADRERDLEYQRKRREWEIRRQKEKEHEELKRQKIAEWERLHAEELAEQRRKKDGKEINRSKSPKKSVEHSARYRSRSRNHRDKPVMSERIDSSEDNKPFFKGPEETKKIDTEELREITVKIVRHIPATSTDTNNKIRRDVINPEEITLKRREGEGSKPIFEREELKKIVPTEVEERRIIATTKKNLIRKKHRSRSLSPRRHHRSPDYRHDSTSRSHHQSRCRSRERTKSNENVKRHHEKERRSVSRERDNSKYSSGRSDEKIYTDERSRSHDRSYDRRDRREQHSYNPNYVGIVPYPAYFDPYTPRPMPMITPGTRPAMRPLLPPGVSQPMTFAYPPSRFMGIQQNFYRNMRPPNPRFPR